MVSASSVVFSTGRATVLLRTVTRQAVFSPRSLQAVMEAVPSEWPVTLPVPSTDATEGALDVQIRKK